MLVVMGGLDLLLPARCAGCGAPGEACCVRCRCGFTGPLTLPCELPGGQAAFAMAAYRGAARQVVLAYKERGRRDLAVPLGRLLAAGILELRATLADPREGGNGELRAAACPVALVPVPSRAVASRVRGGPHVERLAVECAVALAASGVAAAVAPALRLAAGARDAVGMDAAARAENLAGRLLAVPASLPPAGAAVVVVDDVITTGATAAAAVRALAAAKVQIAAVLALTSPRASTLRVSPPRARPP